MTLFRTTIAGNTETFYFTGKDAAGNPEDITGDGITFRAWDDDGNEIEITEAAMTIYAQSGATLGQAAIQIIPSDYPAAWLALAYGKTRQVNVAIERVRSADDVIETQFGTWKITGQGIV